MNESGLAIKLSIVLVVLLIFTIGGHVLLGENLARFFAVLRDSQQGFWVAVVVFMGLVGDIFLPVPASVLSVWAYASQGVVVGFVVVWLGMTSACVLGYGLGIGAGRGLSARWVEPSDLDATQQLFNRFGSLALVLCRAVPVLAEASVICAGVGRMPFRQFILVSALANVGIALAYCAVVAWADTRASFALAFAASIFLPVVALGGYRLVRMNVTSESRVEELGDQTLVPRFSVDFSYPVSFTRDAFADDNHSLAEHLRRDKSPNAPVKVQFFVDQGVLDGTPKLDARIQRYCDLHHLNLVDRVHPVPGADSAKNQQQIAQLHDLMLAGHMDRQSFVVAIGGGGVLDAVGYAAATFHRGVRLIRMPTTVLAQNDAGVGVKNGINSQGIKNLLGCFTVPYAIINDSLFLDSLSDRDFRAGFAEAIKVALIRDADFYYWIAANADALSAREEGASQYLIKRCAQLHLNQICLGGDPFEMGSARPLDYGHWSAHKLESITHHAVSHGEAVAIGMALDALYAVEVGLLDASVAASIIQLLTRLGFDVWHPALREETAEGESALLQGLEEFRQHLGGQLCITLLTAIGGTVEASAIDPASLMSARDTLANLAANQTHGARGWAQA